MTQLFPFVRIQVLLPLPLSGPFDYLVEGDLLARSGSVMAGSILERGDFVKVPLGSRVLQGVVWSLDQGSDEIDEDKLKPVIDRLELPPLPETLLDFIDWVASYTLSPLGAVLKMAVSVPRLFDHARTKNHYRLCPDFIKNPPDKLSKGRTQLFNSSIGEMPMSVKDWMELAAVGEGVIRGMIKDRQLIAYEVMGDEPFPEPDQYIVGPELSQEQNGASEHLRHMVRLEKFKTVLLEGITGSGKTEVYFEAVAEALKNPDGQILVLVPEIALTAQWLERFKVRFGVEPVVWHSELTPAQRRRAWWGVAGRLGTTRDHKRARVIVGARSALFLPFQDLKLIVVDEEHSQTFKQEDGVMYQGRDMAIVRAMKSGCPAILASATPSLETILNAEAGKYD